MSTREGLGRGSGAALFLCAGFITIVNQLVARPSGTRTAVVLSFGVISLVSGALVFFAFRRGLPSWARVAIAGWGLILLVVTAWLGNTVASPKEPTAVVVFMMVILVWLGLTAERGTATAFAPVMIGAAALLSALPHSKVVLADAALVIAVSTAVAETIAWAMHELGRREEQLATLAMTDPLTGLLNRTAFTDRLTEACQGTERVVLAFVDLNGFKDVNDTFGHQSGDAVLVEVGERLSCVARTHDVVGRFGGDEFVMLFRQIPPDVQPHSLVERIRAVLAEPWSGLGAMQVTASVGVVDSAEASSDPEELIRAADTAMYSRKHGTESADSPKLMTSRALAHHRAAMDGLGGGFCVLRRVASRNDWVIVEANERVRAVYQSVCVDPVGLLLSEANQVADNSGAEALYAEALTTGRRAELEIELKIPGEGPSWRRLVAIPVAEETVAVLTSDITAERAALQGLADAVEYSYAVVESAADAILTVDADGHIAGFNLAAEAVFGIDRTHAIGRPYHEFAPMASIPALRAALTASATSRIETQLSRADGTRFTAQVAISEVVTSHATLYTAIVRDLSEQRRAESALQVALECDELTGRPNLHSLFLRADEAADRARAAGTTIGVLFVDLDRFTLVNDSLGHDLGDGLLIDVADRIATVVRGGDVVARISGDHFVVLCERVDTETALVELASRIHAVLHTPFTLGSGQEVFLTASIGAASWHGDEAPRDLVRFAHTAMQQAKRSGPSGVRMFSGDMAIVSASRLEAETALRRALDRQELVAYYQPIVDLASGATIGVEALMRWNHPTRGVVPPVEFIGLAEETGLIVGLGDWMLHQAMRDCASWQSSAPGIGVSINVSAHQFRSGDLVGTVRKLLVALELESELVTLEITESLMLEHSSWNLAMLEELRALGVLLALDDFGTGYSALTHLRKLPLTTIKMDRSFLDGIDAGDCEATVRAVVALAGVYGIGVVAEGIETDSARALVESAGCERGQGYLFGRPGPLSDIFPTMRGRAFDAAGTSSPRA